MLAMGKRPCEIQLKFSEQSQQIKLQQINYYRNKFNELPPETQARYLPENLNSSFAKQEVRINDDIADIQHLNEKLAIGVKLDKILDIIRLKLQIKNRIAQEKGEALSYAKNPPTSNVQILNKLQIQLNENIEKLVNLPREKIPKIIEGEFENESGREETQRTD